MKTILASTLVVLTSLALKAPKVLSQTQPFNASFQRNEKVTRVSQRQMQQLMKTHPIRKQMKANPPKPQAYWKIYAADSFVLACWVDDDSNEIEFCDVYL